MPCSCPIKSDERAITSFSLFDFVQCQHRNYNARSSGSYETPFRPSTAFAVQPAK
jgi:hypothetical protein